MSSSPLVPSQSSPLSLTPVQRSYLLFLGRFVSLAANNDGVGVGRAWQLVPSLASKLDVPALELERSLLDALVLVHVFAGVPKTIEALHACHDVRRHDFSASLPPVADRLWHAQISQNPQFGQPHFQLPAPCPACQDPNSSAIRQARAVATVDAIYTSASAGVQSSLRTLHPHLHAGIISHGYGFMMNGFGRLRLFEVETVAAAVLSGLHTPRQLLSHLRGALIVGLPAEFISQLLEDCFEDVWADDGIYGETQEVWRTLQRQLKEKQLRASGKPIDPQQRQRDIEHQQYEDEVKKSARLAKQGQRHPLFSAGQAMGHGDPDEEADEVERQREGKALTAPQLPQTEQLRPPTNGASSQSTTAANGEGATPAAAVSDEDIETTMRSMMRRRQKDILEERERRESGGPTAAQRMSDNPNAWPIPVHLLDPSGGGGGPGLPGSQGMNMSGLGLGMGGMNSMVGGVGAPPPDFDMGSRMSAGMGIGFGGPPTATAGPRSRL